MKSFVWILFAHFMGDYAFQSDWMARAKQSSWYVLVAHCMIWTACVSIALEYNHMFTLYKALFLFLGHLWFDYGKIQILKTGVQKELALFIDQIAHFFQCIIVFVFK
jgi:hypothetical protein